MGADVSTLVAATPGCPGHVHQCVPPGVRCVVPGAAGARSELREALDEYRCGVTQRTAIIHCQGSLALKNKHPK